MSSSWLNAIDKRKHAGVLSFDLSSAFDSIDSTILCKKLRIYGFNESAINWIRSYLSNRQQFVQFSGQKSSILTIVIGAPQGSCLSPIFFIILLADISDWTINALIEGFADDISATVIEDSTNKVISNLEKDATNILKFMASNKLIANDSKTMFILFGKKPHDNTKYSLSVGNSIIMEQPTIKLLGLNISNDLKWNNHLDQTLNTLNHRMFLFRHVRKFLPDHVIHIVSDALITSHIRYVLPLFTHPRISEHSSQSSISNKLQVVQNQMTRTWLKVKLSDKVNMAKARTNLGFMSVNQMAVFSILSETRKILVNDTIPWIKTILTSYGTTEITTRAKSTNKLRSQSSNSQKNANGFIHQASLLWNMIPSELRDPSCSDVAFKRNLKRWIQASNIP